MRNWLPAASIICVSQINSKVTGRCGFLWASLCTHLIFTICAFPNAPHWIRLWRVEVWLLLECLWYVTHWVLSVSWYILAQTCLRLVERLLTTPFPKIEKNFCCTRNHYLALPWSHQAQNGSQGNSKRFGWGKGWEKTWSVESKSEREGKGNLFAPDQAVTWFLGQLAHWGKPCYLVALDTLFHPLWKMGDKLLQHYEVNDLLRTPSSHLQQAFRSCWVNANRWLCSLSVFENTGAAVLLLANLDGLPNHKQH